MSSELVVPMRLSNLELPVEELFRRACPLPPHDEMLIDDLDEAERVWRFSLRSTGEPAARVAARS